ncbi:MAG: N-acetylmuramoyl-L-alanine amidase [Anaerolineae bacterium]
MTYRSIGIEVDDGAYQRAVSRAVSEGKTINQVLARLLVDYAQSATQPAPSRPASPTVSRPAPTATTSTYRVQSGDTLGAIARKVYGDARKYPIIQQANNITDPRRIWVGQVLVIPALNGGETASTSTTASTPRPTVTTPAPGPVAVSPGAGAPEITWVGSPNFDRRPNPNDISAIVMHATANGSLERVVDWFNNPAARVSAHYTVGKDGRIVQHVRDRDRAWHAGKSEWQGRKSLNGWSIGIEMVNWNNGQDPYPEPQHQAVVQLCAYLCRRYNIRPDLIIGHRDVSPGRKTDPLGYDLERLRREVRTALGQ